MLDTLSQVPVEKAVTGSKTFNDLATSHLNQTNLRHL